MTRERLPRLPGNSRLHLPKDHFCPALCAWSLRFAVALGMVVQVLLLAVPAMAQMAPATLPDLRLSTAGQVNAIAVQDDGKVIVGGLFTSVNDVPRTNLARLNANGSVDLTWLAGANDAVSAIALSGGNIFIGGAFTNANGVGRKYLAKLSGSDGALDATWNPSPNDIVQAIAVAGVNVLVGGAFTNIGGLVRNRIAIVSNAGTGSVNNWSPNPNNTVQVIAVAGGDIFVGGKFTQISGFARDHVAKLAFPPALPLDLSWNPTLFPTNASSPDIFALAVLRTNIFIAGSFSNSPGLKHLAKLSTSGSGAVDMDFSGPPLFGGFIRCLAVETNSQFPGDDYLYTGGDYIEASAARYLAKRSARFGNGVGLWPPGLDSPAMALVVAPAGVYVGGNFKKISEPPPNVDVESVALGIARLNSTTGQRDQNFPAQVQRPGIVYAFARQGDGKIIVGGDFWTAGGLPRQNLARIKIDGALDLAWSPNANGIVRALAIPTPALSGVDQVFVGGSFTKIGGVNRAKLAKVATTGSDQVDTNWNARTFSGEIYALAAGLAAFLPNPPSYPYLFVGGSGLGGIGGNASVNSIALLDGYSGTSEMNWSPPNIQSGPVYALAVSSTASLVLYVGGEFSSGGGGNSVAKIVTSATSPGGVMGIPDSSFVPPVVSGTNGGFPPVYALTLALSSLFVGGDFTNVNGCQRFSLAKLNANTGSLDTNWNPSASRASVRCLARAGLNPCVGGTFTQMGGLPRTNLALLSFTGAGDADSLFNPSPSGTPYALLGAGSDLYAGGDFRATYGITRNGFAFLPKVAAPVFLQDTLTDFIMARNPSDGQEVTHFRITSISGGTLYRSDGVTPVNVGDFLTVAQGEAGFRFATGGTVSAVSSVNNTPAGVGTNTATFTLTTNPPAVFRLSSSAYTVREGQGNIVIPVRKFGNGAATVDFQTTDITATGGVDYQTNRSTLVFSTTDKVKNVILAIADDLQTEGDETFSAALSNPIGAALAGPASATITIVDNDIVGSAASVAAVLPAATPVSNGGLTVSLMPTNANGQWRLVGELNWHASDATVLGLTTGNYAIEFRPANGYRQPPTVTLPITAGMTNQITFFYAATSNPDLGSLSVMIEPDEVASATSLIDRGQWRLQGGATNWLDSGNVIPNLNAGSYAVEFKSVPGRTTPLPQLIEVAADAIYSSVGTYFFASAPGATTPAVVPFVTATSTAPYVYNGQLQTSVGFGSGFVVKQRVVLTAAHVLFDDTLLSYTTYARWFFQRYRDRLEPVPQVARGWYVFAGYAAQRELDDSPGISTPTSQNLDAAALYFLEDAGRGGYGGYLSSDADANEFLLSANNKFLAGYPLEGVTDTNQGKLFATAPANLNFSHLYTSIFATTNIQSFPGNSGGPLYVQTDVDKYLPAAICLGGSGETLVRAINSEVVDLINRAEISGNGGGNIVDGGAITVTPGLTLAPFGAGLLTVLLPSTPSFAQTGWRILENDNTNFILSRTGTVSLIGGDDYRLEFKRVPGFITPSNRLVKVPVGQTATLSVNYIPINPLLSLHRTLGLSIAGATGGNYRVEFATNLIRTATWTPLTTLNLSNPSIRISNTVPVSSGRRYYRAVLVP